jgi:hypothetical protein
MYDNLYITANDSKHIMHTLIEQISQKLPQAPESVLREVLGILDSVDSQKGLSEVKPSDIRDHSAFLNGYSPEDEGLYDDY